MKNSMNKLVISAFLTLFSIVLMVTVSYAWFTLAGSPALEGVQINIGGTNTIKVAPNITQRLESGEIANYPGFFYENFDVSKTGDYDYLKNSVGLTPVSTADGIHWFYLNKEQNTEMQETISLADYQMDNLLQNANITAEEGSVNNQQGSYVYIDFWVVAPISDCTLRVSIGSTEEGSYLIGLPKVVRDNTTESGFRLEQGNNEASTAARVGFLVNDDTVTSNDVMNAYVESAYYSKEYLSLRGNYQKPGENINSDYKYNFVIYEPNGTQHHGNGISLIQDEYGLVYQSCEDGDYIITRPIGYKNGEPVLADVSDILTVQTQNKWKKYHDERMIDQIFQAFIANKDKQEMTDEKLTQYFYYTHLQRNITEYVERAPFYKNTKMLYYSGNGKKSTPEDMRYLEVANATESVSMISLERNIPQRIRMFVWLEGQDVDCAKEITMETFTIGIELAGSTQG